MPRNLRLIRNWLAFSRTIVPSVVLNYEAETAQINHLLQKLKDEDTIKHIDYLDLKRFVTRLENSQAAFEEATKTRSHGKLSQTVYDYRELRQNLLDDYTDICNYIDLLTRRDKEVDYKPLLAIVNHSRKEFANIIKKRQGRKTASATDSPKTDEPQTTKPDTEKDTITSI